MDSKTLEYMGSRVDAARTITKKIVTLTAELAAIESGEPLYARIEFARPGNCRQNYQLSIDAGDFRAFAAAQVRSQIAAAQAELDAI